MNAGARLPADAVTATDYHTAGEPFRIVTGGVPPLGGATILERRRWAAEHLDDVRRLLVFEPRGHADMYGGFVTDPDDGGADLGVVFFHNEGYSTACGHGTIALVTWAIESGRVAASEGETPVVVDVPSGRLACVATVRAGLVETVRFRNVPAWVLARDVRVATSRGPVTLDVAYGGAFYGSLDVRSIGLDVSVAHLPTLIHLQRELRPALDDALPVAHPDEPDIRGIYGVVFWQSEEDDGDAGPGRGRTQRNVTVFADGEVDRSPCGSGTSARLAILAARGEIEAGQRLRHRSIVDTAFEGWIVGPGPEVGGHASVITEVEGSAFRTGEHSFALDPRDPLGTGFLVR